MTDVFSFNWSETSAILGAECRKNFVTKLNLVLSLYSECKWFEIKSYKRQDFFLHCQFVLINLPEHLNFAKHTT